MKRSGALSTKNYATSHPQPPEKADCINIVSCAGLPFKEVQIEKGKDEACEKHFRRTL